MIIKLKAFMDRLEQASYQHFTVYNHQDNLFITLYGSEELEKYLIVEAVSLPQHPDIMEALEHHQQGPVQWEYRPATTAVATGG